MDALDPVLLDLSNGRVAQKHRFFGELFQTGSRPAAVSCFGVLSTRPSPRDQRNRRYRPKERALMITNDVQYRTTKTLLARFQQAVVGLEGGLDTAGNKKLHQLQIDAARAQTEDLAAEIDEYEQLLSGATTSFSADSLSDLPLMLVRARVARGWSQRQLGSALGIAEQQIQRYEANGYATASLSRLCEVADALGLHIRETAVLTPNTNAA